MSRSGLEALLIASIVRFFRDAGRQGRLLRLLGREPGGRDAAVSLRLVDFFLTTFARDRGVVVRGLDVHQAYRTQLRAYSKALFDPFRRQRRVRLLLNGDGDCLETTVAQLNVARWLIEGDVDLYLLDHQQDVEREMLQRARERADAARARRSAAAAKSDGPAGARLSRSCVEARFD